MRTPQTPSYGRWSQATFRLQGFLKRYIWPAIHWFIWLLDECIWLSVEWPLVLLAVPLGVLSISEGLLLASIWTLNTHTQCWSAVMRFVLSAWFALHSGTYLEGYCLRFRFSFGFLISTVFCQAHTWVLLVDTKVRGRPIIQIIFSRMVSFLSTRTIFHLLKFGCPVLAVFAILVAGPHQVIEFVARTCSWTWWIVRAVHVAQQCDSVALHERKWQGIRRFGPGRIRPLPQWKALERGPIIEDISIEIDCEKDNLL